MASGYRLGVDLGTTYTAAAIERDGRVEVCTLGDRTTMIPSLALVRPSGEIVVGEAAERRAASEPTAIAREFKRRLGDPAPLMLGGVSILPEQLMAAVLRHVVHLVSTREDRPPDRVVLSHPASYGPYKTGLMRTVARLADVPDVELVAEPQAAAISYAQRSVIEAGKVVAVYDFGGGTFDAALVRRTPSGGFDIVGQPEGLERLGGIDIDQLLMEHVLDTAGLGEEISATTDEATLAALVELRNRCQAAKEALSVDPDARIAVGVGGVSTAVTVTRDELDQLVRPRVLETVEALQRTIRNSGLSTGDIDRVLLVGGSSRIPLVADTVRATLHRPVAVDANPKTAICEGAALLLATRPAGPPPAAAGGFAAPVLGRTAAAATVAGTAAAATVAGAAAAATSAGGPPLSGSAAPGGTPPPPGGTTPTAPPSGTPPTGSAGGTTPTAPPGGTAPPGAPSFTAPPAGPGGPGAPSGPGGSADAPDPPPPVTPPPKSRRGLLIGIGAAIVAVLIIGGIVALAGGGDDDDSTSTSESIATTVDTTRDSGATTPTPTTAAAATVTTPAAGAATVLPAEPTTTTATASVTQVGKTVYFAGFQIDIATATFTPAENEFDDGKLVLDGIATNLSDGSASIGFIGLNAPVTLQIDGLSNRLDIVGDSVPSGAKGRITMEAALKEFDPAATVVDFGGAQFNGSQLPLGPDPVTTTVPSTQPLSGSTTNSNQLTVTLTDASLQPFSPMASGGGDVAQAPAGQLFLAITAHLTFSGDFDDGVFNPILVRPDGSTDAVFDSDTHLVNPGGQTDDIYVFKIPAEYPGNYVLRFSTGRGEGTNEIPFTLS